MATLKLTYLLHRDTQIGEHAALGFDEAEIPLRVAAPELLHQIAAQSLDTLAHGAKLIDPQPSQGMVVQDLLDDRSAVVRWHRVDAARDAHQLCQNGFSRD